MNPNKNLYKDWNPTPWIIASGHPGGWRVIRHLEGNGRTMQELEGKTGRVILFKYWENAQRKADELNLQGSKQP